MQEIEQWFTAEEKTYMGTDERKKRTLIRLKQIELVDKLERQLRQELKEESMLASDVYDNSDNDNIDNDLDHQIREFLYREKNRLEILRIIASNFPNLSSSAQSKHC